MKAVFCKGIRVHCVGIGGIGVSALARWLRHIGARVSGEDRTASTVTTQLQREGIQVAVTQGGTVPDVDAIVFSDAVPEHHATLQSARKKSIPCFPYAKALAMMTSGYRIIAVAGTHGKSTTTTLIGLLLEAAGVDPTVVVGTLVPQWEHSNFRAGQSDIAVVEADEHNRHFLELSPYIAVVTNVDYDHVDVYGSREEYVEAFRQFVERVPSKGAVVLHTSDNATPALRAATRAEVRTFGVASGTSWADGETRFILMINGKRADPYTIGIPGDHMAHNAAAALAATRPWNVSGDALSSFRGTWRRFERVGKCNEAEIISDYAHCPAELQALLLAVKAYAPKKRVVLAFQPHHRARTAAFAKEFVRSFCGADVVILSELYDVAGRQVGTALTVEDWVPEIEKRCGARVQFCPTLEETEDAIRKTAQQGDIVIVAGAGNIDTVARKLCGSCFSHT